MIFLATLKVDGKLSTCRCWFLPATGCNWKPWCLSLREPGMTSIVFEFSGIATSNTIPVDATPTDVVEIPDIIPKSPE